MQDDLPPSQAKVGLGFLLSATRRRVKQVVWARLAPLGLTPQQFWIMLILHRKGPLSLHALAQEVWMDDPTASRVVKTLCERGLLVSAPDPGHGRRVVIQPTDEGACMTQDLERIAEEVRDRLVDGLNEAEQVAVRRALTRMMANMDAFAEDLAMHPRPLSPPEARRRPLKVSNQ